MVFVCQYQSPSKILKYFAIEKHFDDQYIITPLSFIANLLGDSDHRTALEIKIRPGTSIQKVKNICIKLLPPQFQVLTQDEQQATLIRTMHTERVLVFTTLTILVMIASLNIFFILSKVSSASLF